MLALDAGESVSVGQLAMAVWGDAQPADSRRALQVCVARLRAALGSEAIGTARYGYRLDADPDHVDAVRFVRLLDAAARTADRAQERARLVEALELWRGTPFQDLKSAWLSGVVAARLVERYLAGMERLIDISIADGRSIDVIAQLGELTAQHPLRERFWGQLMHALWSVGRQAEALEAYQRLYQLLADELGIEPGPAVRDMHLRILKSESAVAAQPGSIAPAERQVALDGVKDAPTGPPTGQPPVPEQLPATISYLVGRAGHLAHLDTLLPDQEDTAPTAVVISAITGAAGTGKTALAVHWARRVADRFPDGQLWVNLRGFDPSGVPLWPADAIRGFLHALGTAPHRVPADLDAQVGLYRTRLAGKRALVILDNARDADQVRPLLPGAGGCMVVVTSRDQLAGLVAHDGAHLLNVDVLTRDEAVRLLTIRLGPQRAAAEPETVQSIAERCAMHPLALNVIAARAMTRPAFPLAAIAAELHEAQGRLDTLSGADPLTDVRAAFAMSYRTLSSEVARVFRLLGLHPGPDTSVAAAASLVGLPVARVRASLAKLAGIHLIVEHQPGRYSFHDLLRAYAAELAATHDSGDDRRAAIRRMLDHYLHSARATVYELYPQRDHPMSLMEPAAGVVSERLGEGGAPPLDWFATELAVMQAGLRLAVQTGLDRHVCQLAWTLGGYLARSGRWLDWVATQHASLEAAERLGDQVEQARAHRSLARAYRQLGRFDDAHVHLRQALDLCGMVGDQHGLGRTHALLGQLFEAQDDLHTALDHARQAIQRFRSAGDPAGQALALNSAGWSHARLADYEQALTLCAEALSLQQTTGDRYGEATTWDSLGYAYHHLGDFQQAIVCYKSSLTLRHEGGERYGEATTLIRLGDTHLVLGDTRAAGDAWRKAGGILDELEHLDAQRAHTRLQQLEAVRPPRHDQQHARSGR